MSIYADSLREKAKELRSGVESLELGSNALEGALSDLLVMQDVAQMHERIRGIIQTLPRGESELNLAASIVGSIHARMLESQADFVEMTLAQEWIDESKAIRSEQRSLNQQMQLAAAKGEWDEWQRLVDEYGTQLQSRGADRLGINNDGGVSEGTGGGTQEGIGPKEAGEDVRGGVPAPQPETRR